MKGQREDVYSSPIVPYSRLTTWGRGLSELRKVGIYLRRT